MKLRTNLSTRPFYNVRVVHAVLALAAVVVVGFTLLNLVQFVRLSDAQSALGTRASEAETQAARLRAEAARIRTQIDQKELDAVMAAAREANGIIDRRAFSWTDLLAQLEATLPDDVRVVSVEPRLDKDRFKVGIVAEARRAEDVAAFIDALENTRLFRNVVPTEQRADEQGLLQVAIDSEYAPAHGSGTANGEGAARD